MLPRRLQPPTLAGALLAASLALTVTLSGCAGGSRADGPAATPAVDPIDLPSPAPSTSPVETTTTSTTTTKKAAVASALAIAGADTEIDGDKVHLDVLSLQRGAGGRVTLKVRLAMAHGSYNFNGAGQANPYLLDPASQKKYPIAKDDDGTCICSTGDPLVDGSGPKEFFNTFVPVPPSVGPLTIIFPDFPPVKNVPVS
jgi:hypothetical protein